MGETQRVRSYAVLVVTTLLGGLLWSRPSAPPQPRTASLTTFPQFATHQNTVAREVFPEETLRWTPIRYIAAYDRSPQYVSIAYDQHDGMRAVVKLDAVTGERKLLRLLWRPKASDTDLYVLFDSRPLLPLAAATDLARNSLQRLSRSEIAPPTNWKQQGPAEASENICTLQWHGSEGAKQHRAKVVVDRLTGTVREIVYE
jgi:hypothetical protein